MAIKTSEELRKMHQTLENLLAISNDQDVIETCEFCIGLISQEILCNLFCNNEV